jgi:hypothetical protein
MTGVRWKVVGTLAQPLKFNKVTTARIDAPLHGRLPDREDRKLGERDPERPGIGADQLPIPRT